MRYFLTAFIFFTLILTITFTVDAAELSYIPTNQVTVECEHPGPIIDGTIKSFTWYTKDESNPPVEYGTSPSCSKTFTLKENTILTVGVKAVLSKGDTVITESATVFSDSPESTNNSPFGIVYITIQAPVLIKP